MKLMQPITSLEIPEGDEWIYEVKYDGFRCVLHWDVDSIRLVSRKDIDLTDKFPEIIEFCLANQKEIKKLLPLKIDGELAIINNTYQANFMAIQKRGRLNKKETIEKAAKVRPATFLAFDLLHQHGAFMMKKPFTERKKHLISFFNLAKFDPSITSLSRLGLISSHGNAAGLSEQVFNCKGEGVIAKRKKSLYNSGKQHKDWLKVKNWRTLNGILTFLDAKNDYFTVSVYEKEKVIEIGKCKHGVDSNELETVKKLFESRGEKLGGGYTLPPAICAEINTLDLIKGELREPSINQLLVNTSSSECTIGKMNLDMAMLPSHLEPGNTTKIFWPKEGVSKAELLIYLREVSPYMLPFLKDRILTVIRCPDGVTEQFFFQKHLPDYAPSFIRGVRQNDEEFFICDQMESLLWFGNHGAVEFHTPFQTIEGPNPTEIVFDLDPPDRDRFHLAIHAANILKQLLDDLKLVSFVKTSGNKGIQVHIPIPKDSLTYDETGTFTQAIAWTIENEYPTMFTTERLKKKRKDRLYLDYVQHGKDKTIITAYSPRKTAEASVATPLFWEEVKEGLTPEMFTINNVIERVQTYGCPFNGYFETGKKQEMESVLNLLKG